MSDCLPEKPPTGRDKPVRASFKHATDGVMHCFRTQRHLAHYFVAIAIAAVAAAFLRLGTLELLFVFSAIVFVLVAEMMNTAVETVVNMLSPGYSEGARIAKDTVAAAVLVACCYAVAVMLVVYFSPARARDVFSGAFLQRSMGPVELSLIAFALVVLTIVALKERTGRGSFLRGGAISGHSALAFFCATCLFFVMQNRVWALLAFIMAGLVAQSRVEGRIHSLREVVLGAGVGGGFAAAVHLIGAWATVVR